MMNGQSGQALPLAILALAIGSLVVAPFLGYAGSDLIGSRVYGEAIARQSAGDAGIEHAIWSLTRGTLAEQFSQPGDQVTYQLDETLNGMTVSVTVTANATGGGISAGDISDTPIGTLEFDTANGYEPCIIHVSGNVYVIAYRGSGSDGFLKTVSIDAGGQIGSSAIDTLEYDTSNGYEPSIIHVSGNVYAIVYRGSGSEGFLKTISIDAGGQIGSSAIDTLEYDTSNGYEPSIINVSGNIYAIAYRGSGSDGFLKTISINAAGQIGSSPIDTLEYDTSNGYEPSIIHISGNVYAIVYRGSGSDGFLKTVSIDAGGQIGSSAIDTLEYDTSSGYEPSIIHVSGNVYAIVYRGSGSDGFLKTISIDDSGQIGSSAIDTLEYDTSSGYEPSIIHVSGNVYAIAYRGSGSDGFLKTISIDDSGQIGSSVIDTLEYDTSNGYEPSIINVSGDIYAIAYRGTADNGYLKTVSIDPGGNIGNSTIDTYTFDSYGHEPRLISVSDDMFAIAYRGPGNRGYLKTISIASGGDIAGSVTGTMPFDASSGYEPVIINTSGDIYAIAYRGPSRDGFVKTVAIAGTGGPSSYEIVAAAGDGTIRAFVTIENNTASIVSWQIE
jgi:hypothetical protein